MDCPSCSYPNPDGARFCGDCGLSLAPRKPCPACGEDNPVGQKFCNGCGTALAGAVSEPEPLPAQPADLEGERKQVTVMFADVQGSMELAATVDPETWRAVMDGFYGLLCEEVHRFEGTVDKFTGDGAMAVFGAPVALEDHAARASYAALHIRDRLRDYAGNIRREHGLAFSVRMGLNSGEVVAAAVGSDENVDFTAIGNTVGLAARMESIAEPGRPCLSASTAALVEGYFELEDLGEVKVKGASAPVHTYALVDVGTMRTRLDASRARGLSRFVGRGEELKALGAALERADRAGQVVGVVGEPGLGKSRLCAEFVEECRSRGVEVTEGRGVAHGRRIPLLPVIEMMRAYFGVAEQDDARSAREKIAGRLLLLDDSFRDALPVVFDFLGVPDPANPPPAQMSPEARQRVLFGVVRHLVEARAGEGPGVVLVEDLHWLDPSSEAFLENLVEALPGSRTLLVVNFRPEYRAAWTQRSYYQQLPLVPLDARAIGEMTHDLLGDDPSLDGLDELLAERTGGNPFFVEEVIQGMIESGALAGGRGAYRLTRSLDELTIPPTVHALLAARIDRLPEREKSVLQSAAVIGREFTEPVLQAVTELGDAELHATLAALRDAEMVFEKTLYPEAEYAFKHALTEEVAYGALLAERRARLHSRVAEAIEAIYPERLDELAALLANHWEQGGKRLQAGQWNARAAAWAGTHHPVDALRHWRRVRDLLVDVEQSDEARGVRFAACLWILQLGWRFGLDERELEEVFGEGRDLAGDDKTSQALVFLAHGIAVGMAGDIARAHDLVANCERLAEEAGNRAIALCSGTAFWLYLRGRLPEARADMERRLPEYGEDVTLGRDVLGFSPYLWAMMWLGSTLLPEAGALDEARRLADRAVALSTEHEDLEVLGWAESNYLTWADARGEPGEAFEHGRRGVDFAERLGSPFSRFASYFQMASMHAMREEWEESEGWATRALELLDSTKTGEPYRGQALGVLADAVLARGDVERAAEIAERAVEENVRLGTRAFEARTRRVLGCVRQAQGRDEDARRELRAAVVLARECGMPIVAARGLEALGELSEALEIYRAHGAVGHERRVLELLEERAAQPG